MSQYVAWDGNTYQGQPPDGWVPSTDGRWWPPNSLPPEALDIHSPQAHPPAPPLQPPVVQPDPPAAPAGPPAHTWAPPQPNDKPRRWWEKKRFVIPIGVFVGTGIASQLIDTGETPMIDTSETASLDTETDVELPESPFFLPEPRSDSDEEPFWSTSFDVSIPTGHWEARETGRLRLLRAHQRGLIPADKRPRRRGRPFRQRSHPRIHQIKFTDSGRSLHRGGCHDR